jgi:hypothetical protein
VRPPHQSPTVWKHILSLSPEVIAETATPAATFVLLTATAVCFVLTIVLALIACGRVKPDSSDGAVHAVFAGLFLVLVVVLGLGAANSSVAAVSNALEEKAAETSTWLAADYDIDLDVERTAALITGTSFVVDYDGLPTAISILETADGHLSVVDAQQIVLSPVR